MIDLPSEPLDSDWEKAAAKSLIDILSWLANGSFVSADDFCERLRNEHDAIKAVYGHHMTPMERMAQWRAELAEFEQANKIVPIKPSSEDIDLYDPNHGAEEP